MASSELFSYTQEELISIIEQQHGEIQSLLNERRWLHEDSNMQRSQAQECYDKLLKWQAYGNGLAKELENLKKRDEQWKEALTKAVDKLNTERENFTNLENLYSSLKEKNKHLKETSSREACMKNIVLCTITTPFFSIMRTGFGAVGMNHLQFVKVKRKETVRQPPL